MTEGRTVQKLSQSIETAISVGTRTSALRVSKSSSRLCLISASTFCLNWHTEGMYFSSFCRLLSKPWISGGSHPGKNAFASYSLSRRWWPYISNGCRTLTSLSAKVHCSPLMSIALSLLLVTSLPESTRDKSHLSEALWHLRDGVPSGGTVFLTHWLWCQWACL